MKTAGEPGDADLPRGAADPGVGRALLVGDRAGLDGLASALDPQERVVEAPAATARERFDAERFDCVLVDGIDLADALSLLGSASETDPDCVTILVAAVDAAGETAADAAGVTEVVPAGDGDAWVRTVAGLVRQTAERVRVSRQVEFYEALATGMADFVVVFDAAGEVRYVSPSIETVTGVATEDLFEAGAFGLVHPDDVPDMVEALAEMVAEPLGTTAKVETKARHGDGTWRVHEAVAANYLDDPRIEGIVVNVRDVTDPARPTATLTEDVERITDGFFALDTDWRFTYVNETGADLLGHPAEDLVGAVIWDIFPDAKELAFYEQYCRAVASGDPVAFEERYDGDQWYEVRAYPSETGVSVYFRDVSERREQERKFQAIFERAIDAIVIANDDGRYVDANPAACDLFGLSYEDLLGRSIAEFAPEGYDFEHVWRAFTEATHERGTFTLVRPDGTERIVEFSTSTDVLPNWHLSVMRDVTERVGYEHTLRALHDSTRDLLGADTEAAIAEYLVETATEVLDFPVVVVYCFDESENVLRPTAASVDTDRFGEPPVLCADETSITWRTFVAGEPVVLDDVRTSEYVYDPETTFRSGLYVPLGEHGVLVVGSTALGAFDDRTRELADLLAATGEAAFDRVDRESALRERDETLQAQNRQLRRLNRVNEIIREIDTALFQAETRGEIERAVCARLTGDDRFALAWVGELDADGDEVRPRTWDGTERGYLDSVAFDAADCTEPTARAARERETVVVENVAAELRSEPWRKEALARHYQSALTVPLIHDGFAYGVLAVYATRPWAFDETTRAALGQLGRTIAYAIDAVERKRALLSDDVTELEFAITDSNCLFLRLAQQVDCRIGLEGFHGSEEDVVAFVTVSGAPPDDFAAVADESTAVEAATVIRSSGESGLVELRLAGPLLATSLLDKGVVLATLYTDPSETRTTLEVPGTVDVRSTVESVETMFPESEFLARRKRSRPPGGERETYQRLLSRLTDRQREVAQVAYHGGYFESPRTTTGEDLAAAMGVSPPAFHGHLRTVQRKLFAVLFDADVEG